LEVAFRRMRARSRIEITILSSLVLKIHQRSKTCRFDLLPNNIEGALNSVRFCRPLSAVTNLDGRVLELTIVVSASLNCYFFRLLAGTTLALLLATLKRLASRGGRTRTSTRFPVLGRQFRRGLAPAPFFVFWSSPISLAFEPAPDLGT
jgi:hypothetical protein